MNKVVIKGGLPGCGKSTESQRLARKHLKDTGEEAVICSADHFFEDGNGNYNFNPSLLGRAHAACMNKFEGALQDKRSLIIVDNTNTQKWEYEKYVALAKEHGYDVEIDRVKCPDEKTLKGWHHRGQHDVPLKHMYKMWKRWED